MKLGKLRGTFHKKVSSSNPSFMRKELSRIAVVSEVRSGLKMDRVRRSENKSKRTNPVESRVDLHREKLIRSSTIFPILHPSTLLPLPAFSRSWDKMSGWRNGDFYCLGFTLFLERKCLQRLDSEKILS